MRFDDQWLCDQYASGEQSVYTECGYLHPITEIVNICKCFTFNYFTWTWLTKVFKFETTLECNKFSNAGSYRYLKKNGNRNPTSLFKMSFDSWFHW